MNEFAQSIPAMIAVGAGLSILARGTGRSRIKDGFGVWMKAPRWAQIAFGANDNNIQWERVGGALLGFSWLAVGCVGLVTHPQPNTGIYWALALAVTMPLVLEGVLIAVVLIARRGRG